MDQLIPSISVSDISKYYQFNCAKLLKNILNKSSKKKQSSKDVQTKDIFKTSVNALHEASIKWGIEFEKQVVNESANIIDCQNESSFQAINLLKNSQVGQILYQLKLEVPEELYKELNIKGIVKIKNFIPDFIKIVEEDGNKKLMILDAKASNMMRISHQFQVATYAYLLKYIVREIDNLSISDIGGIYLPPLELQTFQMEHLFLKVEQFLRIELPRITLESVTSWCYNSKCKNCNFSDGCREDASNSIAMITHLPLEGTSDSKALIYGWRNEQIKNSTGNNQVNFYLGRSSYIQVKSDKQGQIKEKATEIDIEDLVNSFKNLNLSEKRKQVNNNLIEKEIRKALKHDKTIERSFYSQAFNTQHCIQFIGIPTVNFPQRSDHNLIISMSLDPFSPLSFAWSICLYSGSGQMIKKFQHAESISRLERTSDPKKFVSLISEFIFQLEKVFEYLDERRSHACIFVFSKQEKITIQNSLLKIISSSSNPELFGIQPAAKRCFFNLFEDCSSLIAVSNNVKKGSIELPNEWREFPRLLVLEDAIQENILMNIPGLYRLKDIWTRMVKSTINNSSLYKLLELKIDKLRLESIYEIWASQEDIKYEINHLHQLRLDFVNAAIQAYYDLVEKSEVGAKSKLLFLPPPFTFIKTKSFKNHYLGKLYFFKQIEAFTNCFQQRTKRIKDLTFDVNEVAYGIRLKFDKFILKEGSEWIAKFEFLNNNNETLTLEPSELKEFILVEDTYEGILEAVNFPDMEYRNKLFKCPLTVLCVKEVKEIVNNNSACKFVLLKGTFKKKMNGSPVLFYRLYKRYVDFNLNKVLKTLTEIDKGENGQSIFLEILENPNSWGIGPLIKSDWEKELERRALKLRDSFRMSPSQKSISKKMLERKLQIIWGPPGSGKTHFLALFLTWYLTSVQAHLTSNDNKFIVGITAFTRSAIDNLLERIYQVQKASHKTGEFTLIRLARETKKNPTIDIYEIEARSLLKEIIKSKNINSRKPIIVGGTLWDWFKIKERKDQAWLGCNIMIIDEASQMLVSDTSVALENLNPNNGRLIIAGDHMQLGPILHNSYLESSDDNHPLIFGSIQQYLMAKGNKRISKELESFLKKSNQHDLGGFTSQLTDNWRMNGELAEFFQKIYGSDYKSKNPTLKLDLDEHKLKSISNLQIRNALDPNRAITMIKLSLSDDDKESQSINFISKQLLQKEAEVVEQIVEAYLDSLCHQQLVKPSLFIVTPHHRQRSAIQSKLFKHTSKSDINLQINTVEKMQGQEADLVITCFGFADTEEIKREAAFLFDFNRWNVAVSRARCKAIVITTSEMLNPKSIEVFTDKNMSKGWHFLNTIEQWTKRN